jgi:3-isopropylmalate/(R)-2-methylmalate dehydratase small subunit
MIIQGRAWVFGDNIDTDIINPGTYLLSPLEEASTHAFEAIEPEFSKNVRSGDVIVAGRNFGCGSSRETAPQVIKHLGISCVIAESFARIFFRNAIAVGLPVLVVKDMSDKISPLDEIQISLDDGEVLLKRTGQTLKAIPLHPRMRAFIDAGGIDGILKTLKDTGA